jgi:hypothetical protein
MNFYGSNIELIKKYRTELYDGLKTINLEDREKSVEAVITTKAKDGNIIFQIEKRAKIYRLNSNYYPIEEAKRWVEQYNFDHFYKVISLFGYGNGMFAEQIIKKMHNDDLLLIYEPSLDIFLKVLEDFDLTEIIKNRHIILSVVGINEKQFADSIRDSVAWINLYSQIICCSPQFEHIFEENYRDFLRIIRDNNSRAVVNRNTEAVLGEANACNVIRNLQYISVSNMATDLSKIIPLDIPVIIVAAGPSLDKNVQQLKAAKGKSIIIATDTAINRLLSYNIIPDFTITLDPSKPTMFYTDDRTKDIPLFYHMPSNHEIVSKHNGRKFIYNRDNYVSALLKDCKKSACFNATGGSVATAAFSVCISIGFKRIIMIGLDLAFSGNVTHAGGVQASDQQMQQQMVMVEDINGEMIPSPWNFYTFLLWFNDAIDVCKDVDVIDATEGGAKLKGATIMTLSEAIEKYCILEVNISEIIEKLEPTFNNTEMKKLNEYLQNSIDDLDKTNSKAKQVISYANKLIMLEKKDDPNEGKKANLIKRISNIERWIEKRMVYHLLEPYIAMELSKILKQITQMNNDKEVKDENIDTYQKVIAAYNAVLKGAKEIKPLLVDTLNKYEYKEDEV